MVRPSGSSSRAKLPKNIAVLRSKRRNLSERDCARIDQSSIAFNADNLCLAGLDVADRHNDTSLDALDLPPLSVPTSMRVRALYTPTRQRRNLSPGRTQWTKRCRRGLRACEAEVEPAVRHRWQRVGRFDLNRFADVVAHLLRDGGALLYHQRFTPTQEAERAVFEDIAMIYSCKRLHAALGYASPERFELSQGR